MYFILFKKSLHITTVSITKVMTLQRKNKLKIHVYEVKFREKKTPKDMADCCKKKSFLNPGTNYNNTF